MELGEKLSEVHMAHTAVHVPEAILFTHAIVVVVPIIVAEPLL